MPRRRQVLQLEGNSTSKLQRYGHRKEIHSDVVKGTSSIPSLVGDYTDTESDEADDTEAVATIETANSPAPDLTDDQDVCEEPRNEATQPRNEASTAGAMDDELKNFLSEIEAIPMPGEGPEDSVPVTCEKTWELKAFQELNEKKVEIEECPPEKEKEAEPITKKKDPSKMYSMFVKGEPEFVNSPGQEADKTDNDKSSDVSVGKREDKIEQVLPDEPTTNWNMVQDETTQFHYYWNTVTNEVTWEIPTEYTQFLLLHREYEERIAKYTPEQQKIYKEKKHSKSNGRDTQVTVLSSARSSSAVESVPRRTTSNKSHQKDTVTTVSEQTAGTDSSEYRRHKREKKKKSHKTKKHKHKRGDSSGDEGRDRSPLLIGPTPQLKSLDPPKEGPSLLSIVPYLSDQEDEDSNVPEKSDSMPVLGPEPDSRLTPNISPRSEKEIDVSMPVLGSAEELIDKDVELENEKKSLLTSSKHEEDSNSPPKLDCEDLLQEASSCEKKPDNASEQIPSVTDKSLSVENKLTEPLLKENSSPSSNNDELVSHKIIDEAERVIEEEKDNNIKEEKLTESSHVGNSKTRTNETAETSNVLDSQQAKLLLKRKEVIDMFAENFPSEILPKMLSHNELLNENKKSISVEESEPMEEGEIPDEKDSSCVKQKEDKAVFLISGACSPQSVNIKSHDKNKDTPPLISDVKSIDEKSSLKAMNILASYGTDEEEGELKESDTDNSKKKNEPRRKKTSNIVRKHVSEVHEDKNKVRKHASDFTEDRTKVRKRSSEFNEEKSKVRKHASELQEDKNKVKKHASELHEDKNKVRKHASELHEDKSKVRKHASELQEDKNKVKKQASELHEDKSKVSKHASELQEDKNKVRKQASKLHEEKSKVRNHAYELDEEKSKVSKHSSELHEQKSNDEPGAATVNEDSQISADIDLDDFDDIDRALELALEKKLDQKKVDLHSKDDLISSQDNSKENIQQVVAQDDEHHIISEANRDTKVETEDEEKELKIIVQNTADLALSKLEFLDIGTDNLSRLQVLFIELQTRLSDWTAGGLSTKYFQQQLQVADDLLEQYELSAVPKGWACQWDRDHNRYYYRHKESGHIQWEYPEEKDTPEVKRKESKRKTEDRQRDTSVVEDRKSRSSSSRHKKREEKERSKYDKHDKRSSSHRHRRSKRKRRRDHSSSSSDASGEGSKSQTSKYKNKNKRKKRSRSKARSPSVEIVEGLGEEIEIREVSESPPHETTTQYSRIPLESATPSENVTPLPSLPASPGSLKGESPTRDDNSETIQNVSMEDIQKPVVVPEENIDGFEMEQQPEKIIEEEKKEEVNSAVISRPPQISLPPPQISLPPHVTAMPPELYTAASIAAPETIPTPPVDQPETDNAQETDKQFKKKKKDKKSLAANSSIGMKKKHMNSMVQKWQKVKKEVEKEEKAKEIRQAAIRQKIEELKIPKV